MTDEKSKTKKPRLDVARSTTDARTMSTKKDDEMYDTISISGKEKLENVYISSETMDLDKTEDPKKRAILDELERRKRAKQLTVTTDDEKVQMMLRRLDEPIKLFGERPEDRQTRIRTLLSRMDDEDAQRILRNEEPRAVAEQRAREREEQMKDTWYHEGPATLREARIYLAKYSLPRAKERLEKARISKSQAPQQRAVRLQETHKWTRALTTFCSQAADIRPLAFCEFSPDSKYLATAGWSGLCKLWTVPDCQQVRTYRGHNASSGCVRFHPRATVSLQPSELNLASCAHDGTVMLWNLESDEPIADLEGHVPHRVSRLAFHPSGRFLATCCHDNSWRLFDLEQNDEILYQEGHSKPVYDISFQCDGSVALTGGLDTYGRVWDLRSGRCIMFLEGHQKEILATAFSPNGFQMATGGGDNTCKIWDLRMRRCVYTIPAHNNLLSRIVFEKNTGDYLITGSYDNLIKIWTYPGCQPLKTLTGHEGKIMCVDISSDGKWLCSTSFDRTFKLWAPETL